MKNIKPTLICIPCYNCATQVRRMFHSLDQLKGDCEEILFIDNHSTDLTLRYLKEASSQPQRKHWTVISHQQNYGLGGSFKTAYQYASENNYEYIVWLHGDDQSRFQDLKNLLNLLMREEWDVIFGARFAPGSKLINYSKWRQWGNQFLNTMYSIALKRKVYELGSGLNSYKVSTLSMELVESWPSHIAFDIELLFHYFSGDFKVKQMPIEWIEEDQISNAKNLQVAWSLFKSLVRYKLGHSYNNPSLQLREYNVY